MQIIIFLIEVILIFFLVDMDKFSFKKPKKETIINTNYSCYYQFDESGDTLLVLNNIPKEEKVIIWQNSLLKDEMLTYFPDISKMSDFIENRISDDDETFKENLIEYIEYMQGKYLSGDISQKEFREALEKPDPALPTF